MFLHTTEFSSEPKMKIHGCNIQFIRTSKYLSPFNCGNESHPQEKATWKRVLLTTIVKINGFHYKLALLFIFFVTGNYMRWRVESALCIHLVFAKFCQ